MNDVEFQLPPTIAASRRLVREWKTVAAMVRCYCRDHHASAADFCPECAGLLEYATVRLDRCRFGAEKPTCANCPVHCYQRDRRDQMKIVMRYAGPRMFWQHPILSLRHWLDGFRKAPPPLDERFFSCRRRGDESQIIFPNSLESEPPHVGSYEFNKL